MTRSLESRHLDFATADWQSLKEAIDAPDGPQWVRQLSQEATTELVARCKQLADEHWFIDPRISLRLARLIYRIGVYRGDQNYTALGSMARGDAFIFLGHPRKAWKSLELAEQLFAGIGNKVGAARTWIGRLGVCNDVNRVDEALAGAEKARDIFVQHKEHILLMRLDVNMANIYFVKGNQHEALRWYQSALANQDAKGDTRGLISLNLGVVYWDLMGEAKQAIYYYQQGREAAEVSGAFKNVGLADLNIATVAISQGHYQRALKLLYSALALFTRQNLALYMNHANRHIVECYLLLNRFEEARALALQVIQNYRVNGIMYWEAITLLHLATAEAELQHLTAAEEALLSATGVFANIKAESWIKVIELRLGQIALKQKNLVVAQNYAQSSLNYFAQEEQPLYHGQALLLQAQIYLEQLKLELAAAYGAQALMSAKHSNIPLLRYSAHLIIGHAARYQGDIPRSVRNYSSSIAVIDRVERGLTITLKPNFLEDKSEATRAYIGLQLELGQGKEAFNALEHARAQAFFGYLADRERLQWSLQDTHSSSLLEELDWLRAEHRYWHQIAQGEPVPNESERSVYDAQKARQEIASRERRMRAITEQLYIFSGAMPELTAKLPSSVLTSPSIHEIQENLDPETILVEFYCDGQKFWAFVIAAQDFWVVPLAATVTEVDRLLGQLRLNVDGALRLGPHAPNTQHLTPLAKKLLQQLYLHLLQPLEEHFLECKRIIFVPYGILHYLPLHLLYLQNSYLCERYETMILPAASYYLRKTVSQSSGSLVIAHSWNQKLPFVGDEARMVHTIFGGEMALEGSANRAVLQRKPTQILHIAAHAAFRLDQPDLSFIELADGQLYADDLFQNDLSYELVTLSACETGRARASSGDELIGLGRGFLYAGAGALLASHWRVADDVTPLIMEHFYRALSAGAGKAAALRSAQQAILTLDPQMHPAFWGSFQLMGDARPLSSI